MKKIQIGKHEVKFFDTAENMTMKRYQRFNKYLMIDNEVGSDFSSFDQRLNKSIKLLKKGMQAEAIKELGNFRQMVFNSFMEYSPKNLALALLVESIDGEKCKDISGGGLNYVLEKLEEIGLTKALANEIVEEVKKK